MTTMFIPGDCVRCIDARGSADKLEAGKLYTVKGYIAYPSGFGYIELEDVYLPAGAGWHPSRFVLNCDTELAKVTAMLARAGNPPRRWHITELDGVAFDGTCVVIGSEKDDEPYTEFIFDKVGSLVKARTYIEGRSF